jgi:recombination protein RecA
MKRGKKKNGSLSEQVKAHAEKEIPPTKEYDGSDTFISTGSTLLDLAISGGRRRAGGIPGGILVEIFGPEGCGKTVMLCEIAGAIQRQGGDCKYMDPEARLNKTFARTFDMDVDTMEIEIPDTVQGMFEPVRSWDPDNGRINGILGDSLAALSTQIEMEGVDKMGMRRAKDFSTELRKTCRIITKKNFLMVCSNQIREVTDAGPYEQKTKSTGGRAIGFYASLRIRCTRPSPIYVTKKIRGKEYKRAIGVNTYMDIYKSSVWEPYHSAVVPIIFNYGIDDVRANLQYVKTMTGEKVYTVNGESVGKSLEDAIRNVEENNLERKLRKETIVLWHAFEEKFKQTRKRKQR